MDKIIHLPPADGITGKSSNIYKEYHILRKYSADFNIWVKRQYAKQNARCFYCYLPLKDRRLNVEHVIPMSKGGTNHYRNLVLACANCNKEKGSNLLPKDYIQRQYKKMKKRNRREAVSYNLHNKIQESIAKDLNWIE